jgi:hypothetical protein
MGIGGSFEQGRGAGSQREYREKPADASREVGDVPPERRAEEKPQGADPDTAEGDERDEEEEPEDS